MKIVVVSPYATVAPHFETELEIIQRHQDSGDQVDVLCCLGELPNCDFNPDKEAQRCQDCIARRKMGLQLIEPRQASRPLVDRRRGQRRATEPPFKTIEQLKAYRLERFDLGYAALSSLVSSCRDPEPDLPQRQARLGRFVRSAEQVYRTMLDYLQESAPDRVYVFNGRFAAMRAVLRACQQMGVDCHVHERGCDRQHYQLYRNHLPHDIDYVEQRMRRAWAGAADLADREEIASQWFHDRANRIERHWYSYVKRQSRGSLPANWNPQRENVVVFCSSEDEFVSIGDSWRNPLFKNQNEGIRQLLAAKDCSANAHVYVRVHPNLANLDNQQTRQLLAMRHPLMTVIPADSPVDSYQLLHSCDKTISFGSSMGIEAVFWRRPSILLGPCFYQRLGGTYQPQSVEELCKMLDRQLAPGEREGALVYGYWFQTHGTKYQYFEPTGFFEGTFKGQVVYARKLRALALRLSHAFGRARRTFGL